MTRSFLVKLSAGVLAASLLLTGGVFGLRFDAVPEATAAPVPKVEMAKAEDVTPALVELLSQPAVQRELKLSADARVALIDGFDKLEVEAEDARREPPGYLGQAAAPRRMWEVPPEARDKITKTRRELVAGIITKGQFARLQQCEVQVLGTNALLLKRVQDALALTDDQKKAVREANTVAGTAPVAVPQLVQAPNGPGGAQLPLVGEGGSDAPQTGSKLDEVVKGFSSAQEKKWKELNGEKAGFNLRRVSDNCVAVFTQLGPETTPPATGAPDAGPQPAPPLPQQGPFPLPPPVQPLPPPANPGK